MDTTENAPALPAEPRSVQESIALPTDYPARGGVPQCIAAAAKPVLLAPGIWEVQAGLGMEAFWCIYGPEEVTKYNFRPWPGAAITFIEFCLQGVLPVLLRANGRATSCWLACTDLNSNIRSRKTVNT